MKTKKAIIFDIDGTLLHTGGCGKVAFNKAFQDLFGIANAWGQTKPDGKTDPALIEELAERHLARKVTPQEYDTLSEKYLHYFRAEMENPSNYRLMPGIPLLLERLTSMENIFLGLGTGNFEEAAWIKVAHGGLRPFFYFGGFGSDSPIRSEIIALAAQRAEALWGTFDPSHVYVVGDTSYDVEAAKKCGFVSIAVGTGKMALDPLAPFTPDHFLADLSDSDLFLEILDASTAPI